MSRAVAVPSGNRGYRVVKKLREWFRISGHANATHLAMLVA
jgi:hypothetical protein